MTHRPTLIFLIAKPLTFTHSWTHSRYHSLTHLHIQCHALVHSVILIHSFSCTVTDNYLLTIHLVHVLSLTHAPLHFHAQIFTKYMPHSPVLLDFDITPIPVKNFWVDVCAFCQENTNSANMKPSWCFCVPDSISCINSLYLYIINNYNNNNEVDENDQQWPVCNDLL